MLNQDCPFSFCISTKINKIMDFWEIISYTIVFILGYIYREFILFRDLMKISNNIKNNPKLSDMLVHREIDESSAVDTDNAPIQLQKLKHEVVNDIHYFYLEENNGFICQGKTLSEAAKNYASIKGNNAMGWFLDTQSNKIFYFSNNECVEHQPDGI